MNLMNEINKVEKNEINQIVQAALNRYRELYPEWEISIISLEKKSNRNSDIDRMIKFLNTLKQK